MPKDVTMEIPAKILRTEGAVMRAEAPAAGEEDERRVELSFSSEEPYERFFGIEILGHEEREVDLEWIGSGRAPLLVDHRAGVDHQVGVIERAFIKGGVGRAVVRFGRGARASEVLARVRDGELSAVSVGYRVNEMKLTKESDQGPDEYRVTAWKPLEVSLVSIPADPTVGVGRGEEGAGTVNVRIHKPEEASMAGENQTAADGGNTAARGGIAITPPQNVLSDEERARLTNEARQSESERIREIEAIGARFNVDAEKRGKAIRDGISVGEFRGLVLDQLGERGQEALSNDAMVGLEPREVKRFSFLRAIRALSQPNDRKAQEAAAFEREVSEAAAKKSGKDPSGLLVPTDILRAPMVPQQRDLTVGTATAGGHTVATDLLAASFIDLLRNRMLVRRMGATMLNDLRGDIAIPRQTGGATAYWVAESGAPTESEQAFDQIALSPKTVGAFTDFSRKLMLQSSLDVEAFVRGDLATVLALEVDRASLHGTGAASQPTGLAALAGVNSVAMGTPDGGAPTWAKIVEFETEVAADNADMGNMGYLINARTRGKLKTTEKATNTGIFLMGDSRDADGFNELNGYRAGVSNQVRSDLTKGAGTALSAAFFGNWADWIIGLWSGLDLMVDPYTGSTSGTVRVVALQDVDMDARHPESFSVSLDIDTA